MVRKISLNSYYVLSAEDSKAEGEEIEYGYPITCGDSRAVLLFKKFVCPGINVRCVKVSSCLLSLYGVRVLSVYIHVRQDVVICCGLFSCSLMAS